MNKKGFTLIELLAVIVILAVIALIATPAVLNIIEDSRKSAAEASARNIVSAAKTYYMSETMNGRTVETIDLSGNTLKYDGDQASKGSITFDFGKASGKMYINGYCVEVSVAGVVNSTKVDEEECIVENTPVGSTPISYADGTPLLYDPVNNIKCENSIGNATGINDGCMKWYVFLTTEESSTVNLILDHNTTASVNWNSTYGETPDTVNAKLQEDITNWADDVKLTARLISAAEINQIVPPTYLTWDQTNKATYYYFYSTNGWPACSEAGCNPYAWLFDNTSECMEYGCTIDNNETDGYWTSSLAEYAYAWRVGYAGDLSPREVANSGSDYGVRPVITISKSIFE